MSSYLINRSGVDQVSVEFMQTGRSETSCSLHNDLLDGTKQYHFCVDSMNIPLNNTPLNKHKGTELFKILRRNVGTNIELEDLNTSINIADIVAENTGLAGIIQQIADENLTLDGLLVDLNNAVGAIAIAAAQLAYDDQVAVIVGLQAAYEAQLLVVAAARATNSARSTYTLQQDFLDVQSFVASLRNFARGFREHFQQAGLPDLRHYGGAFDAASANAAIVLPLVAVPVDNDDRFIDFTLDLDGNLRLELTTTFLNNFMIRLTKLGSEILSFTDNTIHTVANGTVTGHGVTHGIADEVQSAVQGVVVYRVEDAPYLYIAPTNNGQIATDFLNPANQTILIAGNTISKIYESKISLYQTFDGRVKCTLDSHFSTPTNVFIQDGVQKNTRTICERFFDKELTTTTHIGDDSTTISGTCYSGQYPIVKKSEPYKQWHKLLMSYNLRFMRFHLFVTYREFDIVKNLWVFKKYPMKIDENNYYDFTLRFISEA